MLVHLSKTSPYLCDISLGPIEQANRMALIPKTILDVKDSFPQLQPVRTPLKLLAPDEIPIENSVLTTDTNPSRQASLQPVWYTEQTIVDDNSEQQQRNSMKSPNHRSDLTHSTLPTIESYSPEIEDEVIEKESLMRKSSTFTIEHQQSINIPSTLNESEKENVIITSTQQERTHPTEPSDESFRALEHLLGLGSTNVNLTMTTTAQESPKSNHESLSLTIVTPTELINQTTTSLHLSYAPAGGGSLPSSQNVLLMPTIESITDPSMNSTMPPPFSVDNSSTDEERSSTTGTVINQQSQNSSLTEESSFHFTDEDDGKQDSQKDDTNTDDESNFSFELNDFPNNSNESINEKVQPPMITIRAPTCADVAYRALIKSRTSGRISQPVKTESPLAKQNKIPLTVRSSLPTTCLLRSSSHRNSKQSNSIKSDECFVNENKIDDDYPRIELVEVVSLPEEDEFSHQQSAGITLNLTETKDIDTGSTSSAEDADRSASLSSSLSSNVQDVSTPTDARMPVLSREFTYNTPTDRITRSSERRRSIIINRQSQISSIEEQQTTINEEEEEEDENNFLYSKPLLTKLSSNPTVISEASGIILQKSLAGSASPSPVITIRKSERLSSNLSPRRNINPLHSSTPSIRTKSLQMVSIGEQEQVTTTVPKQLNVDTSTEEIEMIDNQQQVNLLPQIKLVDRSVQTSPERRIDIGIQTISNRSKTVEQQTTPNRSKTIEQQTTPIVVPIQRSNIQQTSPMNFSTSKIFFENQQQVTPLQSKAILNLRRNVRFQFTPSTDARLTAKEKLEEEQQKQKIPNQILSDNEREEDTEDENKKISKPKKKKKHIQIIKNDENSSENESPIEQKPNETHVTSTTNTNKKTLKRSTRNENKIFNPTETEIIVTTTSPPTLPTKRKNPKTSILPPPETTSPTEPVIKRVKKTETVQILSIEPVSTRSRSKTNSELTELPPSRNLSKKSKKLPNEINENLTNNNKRKNPNSTIKKSKRRLHSVEQDEGLNTADEEETIQIISQPFQLNQEEREKIEGLTVVELKNRLTTYNENIPKGVRKADLVALLIKKETDLLQERKEAEKAPVPVEVPTRKTRRKKY